MCSTREKSPSLVVCLTRERAGNIWIAHGVFFIPMQRPQLYIKHVVDVARDKEDQRAYRFSCIILRQIRPLSFNSALQQSLLNLVGDDEEVAVAKEKQKALMRVMPPYLPRDERVRSYPYPREPPPVCSMRASSDSIEFLIKRRILN